MEYRVAGRGEEDKTRPRFRPYDSGSYRAEAGRGTSYSPSSCNVECVPAWLARFGVVSNGRGGETMLGCCQSSHDVRPLTRSLGRSLGRSLALSRCLQRQQRVTYPTTINHQPSTHYHHYQPIIITTHYILYAVRKMNQSNMPDDPHTPRY